jgi:hypothetical protein
MTELIVTVGERLSTLGELRERLTVRLSKELIAEEFADILENRRRNSIHRIHVSDRCIPVLRVQLQTGKTIRTTP